MPLYSGGLCEAVKLIPPRAFFSRMANATTGVGTSRSATQGRHALAHDDARGLVDEALAQEPGVRRDDEAPVRVAGRAGDARDGGDDPPRVRERELLAEDRAPAGRPESDHERVGFYGARPTDLPRDAGARRPAPRAPRVRLRVPPARGRTDPDGADRSGPGESALPGHERDAKAALLARINADRAAAGAPPVAVDPVAAKAGDAFCLDAARTDVMGHWDVAGRAPYDRYADAGGVDWHGENFSGTSRRGDDLTPGSSSASSSRPTAG